MIINHKKFQWEHFGKDSEIIIGELKFFIHHIKECKEYHKYALWSSFYKTEYKEYIQTIMMFDSKNIEEAELVAENYIKTKIFLNEEIK